MKDKINIAQLLKDCPKGMELDCTMFENVTFVRVDNNREQFPIEIAVGGLRSKYLTKEGCFHDATLLPEAKCVIFPKGKTTWEGFVPCKFKDGDVVTMENACGVHIFIYNYTTDEDGSYGYYVILTSLGNFKINGVCSGRTYRLASKEEKQKLFQVIKENGYKWNEEIKTLEKLPKFKVGDIVKSKNCPEAGSFVIVGVKEDGYIINIKNNYIKFKDQDNYELVPNKFDITTLKPFESRVLVRDKNTDKWKSNFWGFYDIDNAMNYPYECCGNSFAQCIPHKGNEHLLGTTNDCDKFFKTWEK